MKKVYLCDVRVKEDVMSYIPSDCECVGAYDYRPSIKEWQFINMFESRSHVNEYLDIVIEDTIRVAKENNMTLFNGFTWPDAEKEEFFNSWLCEETGEIMLDIRVTAMYTK